MVINLNHYIDQCTNKVAKNTLLAIIRTESKGNPWAINLNAKKRLRYQPLSLTQATNWVNYLEKHDYNFDVGLMQVNIKNIRKYGYHASELLDPCKNLAIGSLILKKNYHAALNQSKAPKSALFMAISAYNTGNYHRGFSNGYVGKVYYNAKVVSQTPSYK